MNRQTAQSDSAEPQASLPGAPETERAPGSGASIAAPARETRSPDRDAELGAAAHRFPLLRLRFVAKTQDGSYRPPTFLGSTLRGALGHALLETVCVREDQACAHCAIAHSCAYPEVFAPVRAADERGPAQPPARFVLEWDPLPGDERRAANGREPRSLRFELLLLGPGTRFAAEVVTATKRALARGLGARRTTFEVVEVATVAPDGRSFAGIGTPFELGAWLTGRPSVAREIEVRLRTPLRVRSQGRFVRDLPFALLVRHAVRRLSLLGVLDRETEARLRATLFGPADAVETRESNLTWTDWVRNSARQDRTMPYGGLTGSTRYRGPLAPFGELLRAAELLHLGKGTPFGLGRLEVWAR